MSHIVSFAIKGLAGRQGTYQRTLNRKVNVFFGLNGTGKTSLLKILAAALSSDAATIEHVRFVRAEVVIYSAHYKQEYQYVLDRTGKQATERAASRRVIRTLRREDGQLIIKSDAEEKWIVDPPLPTPHAGWSHSFLPLSRMFTKAQRSSEKDDFDDLPFEKDLERHWVSYIATLHSTVQRSQQKGLVDILNEVLNVKEEKTPTTSLLDWDLAYQQMVSFLHRHDPKASASTPDAFRTRFQESALFRNVLSHIRKVEQEIAVATAPQTKLEELIARLFSGNKRLKLGANSIEFETDAATIPLRALSSGEKQILRILLASLRVGVSAFLIDEPELSMHVDWQRELIADLQQLNPDAQLIFATHSPEIMADIPDTDIFKL